MYYETKTEQIPGGTSSLFGGGQQVIIQEGSINNTTVAASSVPVTTVNNVTSSRVNQGTASVRTDGSTNRQTAAIQAVSGYTAVTSTSVPIGTFQTLLPKAQKQSVTSAQTNGNASNKIATMPVSTSINIVSATGSESVTSAQTGGNASSQITNMPVSTSTNITSPTQNPSVASAQVNNTASNQATAVPKGSTIQTMLPSGKVPEVTTIQQTVEDSVFSVPTNGLFTLQKEPSSKYLVETNPRFANYKNFISSDYMLQQLGIDPAKTLKRLGDAFYEQKLVREQVTDLTGRYSLNDDSSAEEQYKSLMNNSVTYAKQFHLQVGVVLTKDQMAQLTSDIVWMVEKEVDGQKVLVPQVYLAKSGHMTVKEDGAVIYADKVQIVASGNVNNAGTIKASESVDIKAVNIANYGGTIVGGKRTQLAAGQNIVNFGGTINGDQTLLVAGNDIKNETISFTSTLPFKTQTTAGNIASISANQNLAILAGHDLSITGANVAAGQNIAIHTGGSFTVDSIKEQNRFAAGSYLKDSVRNVVSNITGGANVSITSIKDSTLKGAKITAGNSLDLTAGNNINIIAVKDESILDKTVGSSSNWKRTRTDDETVIGSTLQGGGTVTLKTTAKLSDGTTVTDSEKRGNITIAGSTIKSKNDKVTIAADNNVTIQEITEKHESLVVTHKKESGFFSSKTTDTMDHSLINEVKGSTISGDAVIITSGRELTVQGSNVAGTKDVSLSAKKDVNILSAAETGVSDHYSFTKKSGIFGGGGLGFTIGSKSEKTTTKEQTLGTVGSTIGSEKGNIFLRAGEKVHSAGTTFISGNDLTITGKGVTIDNTINTYDSQTKYEFKQSGLSISIGGGAIATAAKAAGNLERSGQVQDDRLKALYDYKAFQDLKELNKELGNGINKESLGLSINVSLGSSKMTSEETVHTETVNTSNINAGGNVVIKGTEENVTLTGTKLHATDITLDAAKGITLDSAQNKQQTDSKNSSSSWSVGASLGANPGYFGNAGKGSGKEQENGTSHTGSTLEASGTLTLKSGEDTNINGSQAKGEKVVADIKGDLNIASQQDTDDYTAKNKNSGIGFSTGKTGGLTGSVGKGKTDSTYNSITEQAGIVAGKDGFAIHVGKNTDLKGAVIASDATPDKNKLSTDTLTYSDIQNQAEYSASSSGYSIGMKDGKLGMPAPTPGMPVSGDADSTTKSAVATGTIELRSKLNQDLSTLSRDTTGALNALDKIFDKKTVQEKQELANLFGEVAYNAIGDLALSQYKKAQDKRDKATTTEEKAYYQDQMNQWDEGGVNKILLHAVAGGIMSDLGGNGFASGVVSAGVNEAIQKELAKIKDPGLHQLASALVGGVAAKIVGGNAAVGASVAASATKNNFLNHDQQMAFAKALSEAKTDEEKANIVAYYAALSQYNVEQNARQGNLADPEIIEPALLAQLKWITDNTNNGLNYSLQDLSTNIYGTNNSYAYYKNQLDNNNVSNINNPFNVKLDNDNNNYKADPIPGNIADRIQNQTPPTDPNVQKANELIAANAPILTSSDGVKYVRDIHEDGTYDDYYVPNQNSASLVKYNEVSGNLIGKVDSKEGVVVQASAEGSLVQGTLSSPKVGNENYNASVGGEVKIGNGEIWLPKFSYKTLTKSELILGGEANVAKAEGSLTFKMDDYTITARLAGTYGASAKLFWSASPTKVKGGFNFGWGVGGGASVEVEKQ